LAQAQESENEPSFDKETIPFKNRPYTSRTMTQIVCMVSILVIFPILGSSVVVDSFNFTDIPAAEADSPDQPDEHSNEVVVDDVESISLLAPEKGDAVPQFAVTFPGCSCEWNEPGYSCENDILAPDSMAGQPCCCCGFPDCLADHRCTNEQCLLLGVDQEAQIAAEKKRIADMLKGADFVFPGNLPAVIVNLGKGQCTSKKILEKCKEKGLTPVCDHAAYAAQAGASGKEVNKECWTNMHPHHWAQQKGRFEMRKKGFLLPLEFDQKAPGLCFFVIAKSQASRFGHTNSAETAVWTDKRSNIIRTLTERSMGSGHYGYQGPDVPKKSVTIGEVDDGTSELGTWRTLCVKKKPCWDWATCGIKPGDYSRR